MQIEVNVGSSIEISLGTSRCTIPIPRRGYANHSVVVSKSGKFFALYLESGQSEVGWELFELNPTLVHLGGLPYVAGEGHPPVFSADEKWLAMISTVRDIAPDDDHPDALEVSWSELRIQSIPNGQISVSKVNLRFKRPPTEREPDYAAISDFQPPRPVVIEMPWGISSISFPPPEVVTLDGPTNY